MPPPTASLSSAGTLHRYTKRLVAFEHASAPSSSSGGAAPANLVLWIGGLGDGLLTVSYPRTLAAALPPTWALAEVLLTSSYAGFGTSSLARDARELGACVEYFRALRPAAKIVLMGHSTGSQDAMEYVAGKGAAERPKVDGVILQGSVSDREGLRESLSTDTYEKLVKVSKEYIDNGRADDVIPASLGVKVYGRVPVTAYRWDSFLGAEGPGKGDDDYFSSDLSVEKLRETFGAFKDVPLMIVFSEDDEHCPKHIDKQALVNKWTNIVKENGGIVDEQYGGIVPKAHHNYDQDPEEVVQDLCRRVSGFVEKIGKGNLTSSGSHL